MKPIVIDLFNCYSLDNIRAFDSIYREAVSKGCDEVSCSNCPIYYIQENCSFYENHNDRIIEWEDYVNDRKLQIVPIMS